MENIFKLLDCRKDEPINLDNKVDKFIDWCKNNVNGKESAKEINTLINKIASWYELRYPSSDVSRLFLESSQEQSYANEVTFNNNPYVNEICDDKSECRNLDWSDFFNFSVFTELLSWKEKYYFRMLRERILNCAMYRIIQRGGNRIGPRRALLFAKEFERDINIPMMYGVDRSDPYLKTFIHKYLDAGGSRDLVCYEDYFSSTFNLLFPCQIELKDLIKREKPTYYTPQERELYQRLVNALNASNSIHKVKKL